MRRLKFIIILLIASSCFVGEELPPDQQIWEYASPSETGLSENILLSIDSALNFNIFEAINGLIIIKNNKLVFENYYNFNTRHTTFPLIRGSMVFTVAAIGIATEEGLLELSDPIVDYLPGYASAFEENPLKEGITIEHLLTHRSGISWNETIVPFFENPENNLNQMFASTDWIEFILNQPLEAEPGQRYNFNSGTGTIIARIIEETSGQPFDTYLQENLLNTIDITDPFIGQDPSGNFDGGRGMNLSLIDWAKFGYLMVNGGIWNGRRVIDPNFVAESTTEQASVSNSFNLGYGWWLFGDAYENAFPFDKDDVFYIPGEIGQHLYVVPSQDLIIAISAENFFFGFNNPSLNLFSVITTAIQ